MTDPTEQTAEATILGLAINAFKGCTYEDVGIFKGFCEEYGLKEITETPSARLVADLAIAARARACTPVRANRLFGPQYVEVAGETFASARALLAYLLNGEQP